MSQNQFLSFGMAGGAYVYDYATWLLDADRPTGYPPGLVLKERVNTPLRQTAWVTSRIAQFMADQSALDILDNGDSAQFLNRYKIAQRNFAASQRFPLDTGAANAYVVALDPVVTAKVHGTTLTFTPTNTNTGASTLDAGAGASAIVRADGSALRDQDLLAGSTVTVVYDGNTDEYRVQSVLLNQLNRTAAWRYITADTQLTVGSPYLVNTVAGSFNVTLPANPVLGDSLTFIDASNNWGIDTYTILRNGHTIMEHAEDLVVNLNDQMFSMWFNGADWRLV